MIYNANKNKMLEELKDYQEDLSVKMDECRGEVAVIETIRKKVKEYQADFLKGMVECKTRGTAFELTVELMTGRMDDFDSRLRELREHTGIRDKKVDQVIDHLNKMKQIQADASIATSRRFAREL